MRKNGVVSDLPEGHCGTRLPGGKPLTPQLLTERQSLGQNQNLGKGFLLWTNARCTFGYTSYIRLYSPSGEAPGLLQM